MRKLTALLRLALALLQTSGFRLAVARLPDGRDKLRILRAADRAVSTSRCERPCGSCVSRRVGFMPGAAGSARVCSTISLAVRAYPVSTDALEVRAINDLVTAPEYRHVPTGTLAVLAQRLGKAWASRST